MHAHSESLVVLLFSGVVMLFAVQAMAYARLQSADIGELEKLRSEGLLAGASLDRDFRTLSYLLSTVAPAVYMRQEHWVRMYYCSLRVARVLCSTSAWLETEMRKLVAHQATQYCEARARLAEL